MVDRRQILLQVIVDHAWADKCAPEIVSVLADTAGMKAASGAPVSGIL
jgi:hypothetical protein